MAERTERSALNHLIETCRDGERGFHQAAEHVQEPGLKELFTSLSAQRGKFADELLPHAQRLGGADAHDGTSAGALHRRWMFLKESVLPHHDDTILAEAERGEQHAIATYADALAGMLPPTVRDMVERQHTVIRQSLDRLKELDRARHAAL